MTSSRRPPTSSQTVHSLLDRMRRLQGEAEQLLQTKGRKSDNLQPSGRAERSKRALRRTKATSERESDRPRPLVEKELAERLGQILERLDLPSRKELEALSRRVDTLEKTLRSRSAAKRRAR